MKCSHCNTAFNEEFESTDVFEDPNDSKYGYELEYGQCPECKMLIVILHSGTLEEVKVKNEHTYYELKDIKKSETLYPKFTNRKVENEVPATYKNDYQEASSVLNLSPKASAAISRRILQMVLRDEYKIKQKDLANEIEEFIKKPDIPTYLKDAVDAIRNIGNFAAHPLKDTNTGTVVDVEPGEAEWLLEVLDSLFDFTFVQPKRLAQRKKNLNNKLQTLGKPPMKN